MSVCVSTSNSPPGNLGDGVRKPPRGNLPQTVFSGKFTDWTLTEEAGLDQPVPRGLRQCWAGQG